MIKLGSSRTKHSGFPSISIVVSAKFASVIMAFSASVKVYRGLGGEQVSMSSFGLSVPELVLHLEEHTDWLWGIGFAYEFLDMASSSVLSWDHIFEFEESTEVLLHYLPYRITSQGFPCWRCWKFVCWDDLRWYTKYNYSFLRLNIRYFHSSSLEDLSSRMNWLFLYQPREFFCTDCGLVEPDIHGRLERVDRDPITHCVSYTVCV